MHRLHEWIIRLLHLPCLLLETFHTFHGNLFGLDLALTQILECFLGPYWKSLCVSDDDDDDERVR